MRIEVLYPEIANLYGDLANIRYLKECCPNAEIIRTDLKSKPSFLDADVDLVYMGTTTERGLTLISDALRPYKESIAEKIQNGQHILLTGNSMDIFGCGVDADNGWALEGLGLIPTKSKYTMLTRHNSFFLGDFEGNAIVGFKSLFGLNYDFSEENGFCEVTRGVGRNEQSHWEGFRINNLFATHLLGPLLILNPPFTKWLLRNLGASDILAYEDAAMDAYLTRVAEFGEEFRNPIYH